MQPGTRLLPVLALALACGSALHAEPVVTGLTLIAPLHSNADIRPTDINNHGVVVGNGLDPTDTTMGFRWTASGGTTQLPLPAGASYAFAQGINQLGTIVGYTNNPDWSEYGVGWQAGSPTISVGLQPGGGYSYAYSINDSGVVVGTAEIAGGGDRPFIWTAAGGMTLLNSFGGDYGQASAINAHGVVAGYASNADGNKRAFVWDGTTMQALEPHPDNVGSDGFNLVAGHSEARGINDHGQVVGESSGLNGSTPVRWENGEAIALGSLGNSSGDGGAFDINNQGVIVGWSYTTEGIPGAFVYVDGVMYSLADLAAPFMSDGDRAGFLNLQEALAINDLGQIVGYGEYWDGANMGTQGFVLNLAAVPEPSSAAALAGLGALGLVALRRRPRA